ncbi:MAG TPA: TIM barrel protein, partial [Candidatus Sulfotelmatobacter sp.]|nr:TIM barrel protein [Candidatus Sulfotelmatobacter sp.]
AGYDIREEAGYRRMLRDLTACLGCGRVKVIHLNDSKLGLGSRVDRHAHIGDGALGLRTFARFLHEPRFHGTPMILETPKDDDAVRADRRNLGRLRRLLSRGPGETEARSGEVVRA